MDATSHPISGFWFAFPLLSWSFPQNHSGSLLSLVSFTSHNAKGICAYHSYHKNTYIISHQALHSLLLLSSISSYSLSKVTAAYLFCCWAFYQENASCIAVRATVCLHLYKTQLCVFTDKYLEDMYKKLELRERNAGAERHPFFL